MITSRTNIATSILLLIILSGCTFTENKLDYNEQEPIYNKIDNADILQDAIEQYLISQRDFAWDTEQDGKHVCVFEYLQNDHEISPYYLWVRCSEFVLKDEEIEEASGVSIPAKLSYPAEISSLDAANFTHEIPGSGSDYDKDIERIFPLDSREKMSNFHDSMLVNMHYEMAERIMEIFEQQNPPFPTSMKQNCHIDDNCILPFSYAIRSSCPYAMQCLDEKCEVYCPTR
ncbi:hypothetical protein KKF55_03835 [Patescibacteria group bacterium]|nr:hypothetical protein [Patescibacteria group bacterium]